jgi:hypothetical protein
MSFARNALSLAIVLTFALRLSAQDAGKPFEEPPAVDGTRTLASLEQRISAPPQAFLAMFPDRTVTPHVMTPDEHRKFLDAVHKLTPLQQSVLRDRLESFSFVDGIPNTALTYPVNQKDPNTRYYISIRGGVLDDTLSQFLTWKERTMFDFSNSSLTLNVDGGNMDAIVYILLHEATHVVDLSMGLSQGRDRTLYSADRIWQSNRDPVPQYRNALLESILFRTDTEKKISITQAAALYGALSHTPFVSLYGSNNRGDDLAELVAWYDLSQKLGQPYQIQLWDGHTMVFHYDPMRNRKVRKRFGQINFLYR